MDIGGELSGHPNKNAGVICDGVAILLVASSYGNRTYALAW